jgi:hypothetical protein
MKRAELNKNCKKYFSHSNANITGMPDFLNSIFWGKKIKKMNCCNPAKRRFHEFWSKNIWPTDIALTFAFGQQSNGRVFDAEY